jgi:mono/diheme cytochrome c family protein
MKRVVVLLLVLAFPLVAAYGDDGATIYKNKCVLCHGPDGKGDTVMGKKIGAKTLGAPDIQKQTDAQLIEAITKGRGKMPAFGKQLDAGQLASVVKYIRSFGK